MAKRRINKRIRNKAPMMKYIDRDGIVILTRIEKDKNKVGLFKTFDYSGYGRIRRKLIDLEKKEALLRALRESLDENPNVHIISRSKQWAIKISGSDRAYKIVDSKDKAISYAKNLSHTSRTPLGKIIIHKKDGSIESINPRPAANVEGVNK